MAKRAVRAEESGMIGGIAVASGTFAGYWAEHSPFVTLHTGDVPVGSGQWEFGACVIEDGSLPFRRAVAGPAEVAILPLVRIFLNMTLRALGGRAHELPTQVATCTARLRVGTFQRIGRPVVIQRDFRPTPLAVASRAVETQFPGVGVISSVAFEARARRAHEAHVLMAIVAGDLPMSAHQLEGRTLVIKIRPVPGSDGMACTTILPQRAFMDVILGMACHTLPRRRPQVRQVNRPHVAS